MLTRSCIVRCPLRHRPLSLENGPVSSVSRLIRSRDTTGMCRGTGHRTHFPLSSHLDAHIRGISLTCHLAFTSSHTQARLLTCFSSLHISVKTPAHIATESSAPWKSTSFSFPTSLKCFRGALIFENWCQADRHENRSSVFSLCISLCLHPDGIGSISLENEPRFCSRTSPLLNSQISPNEPERKRMPSLRSVQ